MEFYMIILLLALIVLERILKDNQCQKLTAGS